MNCDIKLIRKAWDIATKYHANQKYGGPNEGEQIEYLNHIGSVFMESLHSISNIQHEIDEELLLICSILHDTIEDTQYTRTNLKSDFSAKIYSGVLALTKNEEMNTKEEMMIDSLERILLEPKEVAIVKMCDRICNLSVPPFYWNLEKRKSYVIESKLILDKLRVADDHTGNRLSDTIELYTKKFC